MKKYQKMFDKLNFYGKNSFKVDRIFKFMEVVMFKWQRRVLSLLIVMFMFSFGFNCSAVEDYSIYFNCKETNCSKCQKSLADCISDFPAISPFFHKNNLERCCYIHFERNPNVDIGKIYENKNHFFCKDCMLEYFVDAFDKNNDDLLSDEKKYLKDKDVFFLNNLCYRSSYEILAQKIEKKYIKRYKDEGKGEDGKRYIPFPCEYMNINKINRFDKCSMCYSTLITSLDTAACGNGHMICFDCAKEWEKKDGSSPCYCKSRYWLCSPAISGEDILRKFRNKYV